MKYKGYTLVLDNFRSVLKGFSLDVQDVVRSAILDGVDLEPYLDVCKNNPYKLDQIRLSIKEKQTFDYAYLTGEVIYQIREFLRNKSFDVVEFNRQMKHSLSDEHVTFLLKWLGAGISLKGLDISIIPKSLLEVFDTGLSSGLNMKKYNTGVVYLPDYLAYLVKMEQNRQPVEKFLSGSWNKSVLHIFAIHSGVHTGGWENVYKLVSESDTYHRVNTLLSIAVHSRVVPSKVIETLQSKSEDGGYVYSEDCLDLVYKAVCEGLDVNKVLSVHTATEMKAVIEQLKLDGSRTISGKFVKSGRGNRREGVAPSS